MEECPDRKSARKWCAGKMVNLLPFAATHLPQMGLTAETGSRIGLQLTTKTETATTHKPGGLHHQGRKEGFLFFFRLKMHTKPSRKDRAPPYIRQKRNTPRGGILLPAACHNPAAFFLSFFFSFPRCGEILGLTPAGAGLEISPPSLFFLFFFSFSLCTALTKCRGSRGKGAQQRTTNRGVFSLASYSVVDSRSKNRPGDSLEAAEPLFPAASCMSIRSRIRPKQPRFAVWW